MIYQRFNQAPWDKDRWPNFTPQELSCPCCGEYYHAPIALDALQTARTDVGKSFNVNSAHRCWLHNAHVGGAPLSEHKKIAFDISTNNHGRIELYETLRKAGFTTFGFYLTFIHTDLRPGRMWYASKEAKKLWKPLLKL